MKNLQESLRELSERMRISANNYMSSHDAGYVIGADKAEDWADELDALLQAPADTPICNVCKAMREISDNGEHVCGLSASDAYGLGWRRGNNVDAVAAERERCAKEQLELGKLVAIDAIHSRIGFSNESYKILAAYRGEIEDRVTAIRNSKLDAPSALSGLGDETVAEFDAKEKSIRATPASESPRTRKCGCGVEIPRDNSMCDSCYAAFNDESGVLPIQVPLPSTGSTTLNAPPNRGSNIGED